MTNERIYKNVSLDSKPTEMFGNVQLGKYYTQDIVQIRKDFVNCFESIKPIDSYYFIVHDDSTYLHVHFVILLSCQVRLSTMINRIAEILNVDTLAVSLTQMVSIVGSLKYFLHMTDLSKEDGKKEYSPYELISNESDLIIRGYLDSETDNNVSTRFIRDLVIACDTKSDVLLKINNPRLIKQNRYFIDTFWNDKGTLQLRQKEMDDLPF